MGSLIRGTSGYVAVQKERKFPSQGGPREGPSLIPILREMADAKSKGVQVCTPAQRYGMRGQTSLSFHPRLPPPLRSVLACQTLRPV